MNVSTTKFKFYLHDSVEACRLQLLGPLSFRELSELIGCWNTARTTLKARKLILDISAVTSIDDPGRKWVAAMVAEGALLIEAPVEAPSRPSQNGILKRMFGALLGVNAESPTGAQ
jgi:hypothetical protein